MERADSQLVDELRQEVAAYSNSLMAEEQRANAMHQTVERLEQQVAKLREENKSLMACQCDGCAETLEDNDAYCQKCWAGLQTAHTTLRGLLVQMVTWAEDVTKDWVVDDDRELAADLQLIQACKAATLPREGGAQEEPTKKCLPNCPYCNDPFYGHKGHR